jgi:nucleoside phosphorylase
MFSRQRALALLLLATLAVAIPSVAHGETPVASPCPTRTLVLSAYPAEADAVLSHVTLAEKSAVVVDGHHFYVGTIAGKPVVTAMTGIGLVNATRTATAAIEGLSCDGDGLHIGAVLFSGVAGGAGRSSIGDVTIPARWTLDDGKTWRTVDASMLAAAAPLAAATPPDLTQVNTAGDPACTCLDPSLVPLVDLGRRPVVLLGGDGYSSDSLGDAASPCIAGGGDTFGCEPCHAPDRGPIDPVAATTGALSFLQANTSGGSGTVSGSGRVYDAVDEETAAVQLVADDHQLPFLGFRGISDGPGDPLNLPGFPFQFFLYKQIAADNSATAVESYFTTWSGPPAISDVVAPVTTLLPSMLPTVPHRPATTPARTVTGAEKPAGRFLEPTTPVIRTAPPASTLPASSGDGDEWWRVLAGVAAAAVLAAFCTAAVLTSRRRRAGEPTAG